MEGGTTKKNQLHVAVSDAQELVFLLHLMQYLSLCIYIGESIVHTASTFEAR